MATLRLSTQHIFMAELRIKIRLKRNPLESVVLAKSLVSFSFRLELLQGTYTQWTDDEKHRCECRNLLIIINFTVYTFDFPSTPSTRKPFFSAAYRGRIRAKGKGKLRRE